MQNNAAVANEINMILVSLLKNRTKVITPNNKKIGSVYLTKADELGLHLKKEYFRESLMKEILESLMKSEPNKRFVFNVSPRNKKFMKFLQKNGYVISQQTVVKYFE